MAPSPQFSGHKLYFLKLGGSLITDKDQPHTPRTGVIDRLAEEIHQAISQDSQLRLLVGHGSGSFGHVPAKKYNTIEGVSSPDEWLGFCRVWQEASSLNRLVLKALDRTGLPVISFPPSSSLLADHRQIIAWPLEPMKAALNAHLIPLVFGDAVFDRSLGGTILSTEDLFDHLAGALKPGRILLAGREAGVWADYPHCTELIPEITPATLSRLETILGGSHATDVTGGMASKVRQSLNMIRENPGLEALIFSGEEPGALKKALTGERLGTWLHG